MARRLHPLTVLAVAGTLALVLWFPPAALAAEDAAAAADAETPAEPDGDEPVAGISLPTDRLKERQLDRCRRLLDDGRWSDAATLLDEILASDRDFFFKPDPRGTTSRSIKAEAAGMVGGLPPPGRDAYSLQFRARAEQLLEAAIASGDSAGIVAVARRWFHTPAGRRATLIAALEAMDADQPLAAAVWLDRLSGADGAEFEPTLSLMRARAFWLTGERTTAISILEAARPNAARPVRIGGRDLPLSFPPGRAAEFLAAIGGGSPAAARQRSSEWWLHRGDAARNALVVASRPLLVPRFRVPLTRHPEEARLLEKRRKMYADRDTPLLPAGTPLAVGNLLLARTPLGLLAVDFESGKRVWLQTAGAAATWADELGVDGAVDADAEPGDAKGIAAEQGVFADSTRGQLSSDGRLVFAIESDAGGSVGPNVGQPQFALNGNGRGSLRSNSLAAYDIVDKGTLRWRLPGAVSEEQQPAEAWYMGAPLTVGDQLFVLVEERGEIRLDVLAAADGRLFWSQPLAELDEQSTDGPLSQSRRMAGLSPSFAEGVLVCPTGAGAVVAVDLATRTLLWASNYPMPSPQGAQLIRGGVRVQAPGMFRGIIFNGQLGGLGFGSTGWRDGAVVMSSGVAILAPSESDQLRCLNLRTGELKWEVARGDSLYVAGVVDGKVIIVARHAVDALSLADGQRVWGRPLSLDGASPSGRGILTNNRFFLPLDTPEVIEVDLETGTVAGRSPARGGTVPGNLMACRDEIVSQGVDSLDVFHQAAPLESRIETALRERPADPWPAVWRGQLELDRGHVADGLRLIREARLADPGRIPADIVSDALFHGMRTDFDAAAAVWKEMLAAGEPLPRARPMLCLATDSFLRAGNLPAAWQSCRRLFEEAPLDRRGSGLLDDLSDGSLSLTEPRWFQGRLGTLLRDASPELRGEIEAFVDNEAAGLTTAATPDAERMRRFLEYFGDHPRAMSVRSSLVGLLGRPGPPAPGDADANADDASAPGLQRRWLQMLVADAGTADRPREEDWSLEPGWPLGRVDSHRGRQVRPEESMRLSRVLPIPVVEDPSAAIPGLKLGFEMQTQALVASDGFGRRLGEPFRFDQDGKAGGMGTVFQPGGAEAIVFGPLLVVRSGPFVAAFALPDQSDADSQANGSRLASATPRRLWLVGDAENGLPHHPGGGNFEIGRRIRPQRRGAAFPLGMRISEPDDGLAHGLRLRVSSAGVLILADRMLELRDPLTGVVLWQRHRLPVAGDLICDGSVACVCPNDGREAQVVSLVDGRILGRCDAPVIHNRVMVSGRMIVAVEPCQIAGRQPHEEAAGDSGGVPQAPAGGRSRQRRRARRDFSGDLSPRVRLVRFDPATSLRTVLGEFSGESRAAAAGPGLLAVVEPSGDLAVLDIADATLRFRVRLPEMQGGLQQLQVLPWQDRLLVIVGRRETNAEQQYIQKLGGVQALPQMVAGEEPQAPFTGAIWAIDRNSGESLWPVPATVVRHAIHQRQPTGLPVLLFARQLVPGRDADRPRLSLLCLDKRTGHALLVDDKIMTQPHMLTGCEVQGDPVAHTITLSRTGADVPELRLDFSGEPMAPRPPYQAVGNPPVTGDLMTELEYWIRRTLLLPLPF